ncbi:MAG: hypothetical protein J6W52_07360 [Bacteroidaceae bacterium]|nr:hypothetical protein [Bacteroidaceae bacterium]
MKKNILFVLAITALLLTSCSKEEKNVREFADNFATKVLNNDVRSIRSMIPGVERCESFSVEGYDADKVTVEKQGDAYNVQLTENRSMTVKKDEDGNLKIDATYGVVSFDPDLFDFAVRTGWIDAYMDDSTVAELLSDYEFKEFMIDRITKELRANVTASGGTSGGSSFHGFGITVKNRTNYDIPADAYKVVYRLVYWAFPEDNQTITFDGVDLPAHSSKSMSGNKRGTGMPTESSIRVEFDEEWLPILCMQIYKANGHEYEDWIEGKLN